MKYLCTLWLACCTITVAYAGEDFEKLKLLLERSVANKQPTMQFRSASQVGDIGCTEPAVRFQVTGGPDPWSLLGLPLGFGGMGGMQVEVNSDFERAELKIYGVLGGQVWFGYSTGFPISMMFQCEASPWWTEGFALALRWKIAFGLAFAGSISSGKADAAGASIAYRFSFALMLKKQLLVCSVYAENGEVQSGCE